MNDMPERLLEALDHAAAGRPEGAALAGDLRIALDVDAPERCPPRTLRRVEGFFDERKPSVLEIVGRLVFDSFAEASPAARAMGGERLLRYIGDHAVVDLQIGREVHEDGWTVAVAVERAEDPRVAEVLVDGGVEMEALALDEDGTGSGRIRRGEVVVVTIRDELGALLETPPIHLGSPRTEDGHGTWS